MFKGVFTALITPFDKEGSVDETALRDMVEWQIKKGINGLVPCGTTGESPTLTDAEHAKVIEVVIDQAKERVPVIAGTGSNNTAKAIGWTKHAKELGATASLQVAPYYNKPTQDGFYQHFKKIADDVDLPMIVYNIPGRSGKNIETPTIKKLSTHKNIVAVKEASGSLSQMTDVIDACGNNLNVLSGDDGLTIPLMSIGGKGVISVASNAVPDRMVAMVDAALKGDYDTARKAHYELLPFFKAEFIETNPIPIKAACARMGMCKEIYRLPMCYMQDSNKEKLFAVMDEMGIKKD